MKTKLHRLLLTLVLLALSTLNSQLSTAFAQGTAFTYQGRLNTTNGPASGTYNLTFSLFNTNTGGAAIAGPVTDNAVVVTNGLFIVTIDFGSGVFTGQTNWLQIGVETNGANPFTTLSPRQPILPVPYAIMANTASNLLGMLPASQLSAGTANVSISGSAAGFNGNLTGDVTGTQTATVVSTVGGQSAGNVASGASAANAATSAATPNTIVKRDGTGSFSATNITINGSIAGNGAGLTNLNVSQLVVGGSVGFRIEPGEGGSMPNVIGGTANNSIATYASTIAGGTANVIQTNSQNAAIGGGNLNTILTNAYDSTISGGTGNSIQPWAFQSTIGGGGGNIISNNASYSTIGGGSGNVIQGWANGSTIGGGSGNVIQTNAGFSTIAGGIWNLIQVNALHAAIAGGASNTVSAFATNSSIGGGAMNTIQPNAGYAAIGGGSGNTVQTNADNATIAGGLDNTIQSYDFYSAIGGGNNNSIKMNTSAAVIGGGNGNSIQSNAEYSVISGGDFNTINTNTFGAVIGGGEFNAISNGATYAVIPGGSRAAAIHYGQFAFASGNFSTQGDAQASVYVLRTQENSTAYNSLYLDGGTQMLTVPTGAVWAFDILVVGGINGSSSATFKITGAIRNYGGTVAFVGTPTVTSLGTDMGISNWGVTVAVTAGALDVQAKGTGSAFVSWVANVRTVEVTPTY
jgi:hypothetical protein